MKSRIAAVALVGTLAASAGPGQTQLFAQAPGVVQTRTPRSPFGDTVGAAAPASADERAIPSGSDVHGTDARERLEATRARPARRASRALSPHEGKRSVHGSGQGLSRTGRPANGHCACQGAAHGIRPARLHLSKEGIPRRQHDPRHAAHCAERSDDHECQDAREDPDLRRGRGTGRQSKRHMADQEKLWREVKKIKPACLEKMSSPFPWRTGLGYGDTHHQSLRSRPEPLPAHPGPARHDDEQRPAQHDQLPRAVTACRLPNSRAGRRSASIPTSLQLTSWRACRTARCAPRHDDAERMAEKLANAPEIRQTGQQVYVYHDRTTSKVFIGSFNSPQDPAAAALRNYLVENAYNLSNKSYVAAEHEKPRGKAATDTMIVPALALTDVNKLKHSIK